MVLGDCMEELNTHNIKVSEVNKVVIYGAGEAGKSIYEIANRIKEWEVYWCDSNSDKVASNNLLREVDYEIMIEADGVIIGVWKEEYIQEIYNDLVSNGIDKAKIFLCESIRDTLVKYVNLQQVSSEEVIAENASIHDSFALYHDKAVGYIRRPSCRKYCWKLIDDQVKRKFSKGWQGLRVLELGCATGTFCSIVDDLGIEEYVGIDVSEEMLKVAREKQYKKCRFVLNSLEKFGNVKEYEGTFDVIYSASFLHHLYDIDAGLEIVNTLLSPGGVYVAIHEQIRNQQERVVQKIENVLNVVGGYNGFGRFGWKERIKFIRRELKTRNDYGVSTDVDKVDFQLNEEDFSLSKHCSAHGTVVPYCYYIHLWLRHIDGRPNHEYFVMEKH